MLKREIASTFFLIVGYVQEIVLKLRPRAFARIFARKGAKAQLRFLRF